ncbi:MAG: methionine adenosyltransferase [Candidatus Dormibacteraeota bacterium]|nr:methionine adenosyltransferase [Candidatus Dormibacteraeota bacterium]
MVTGFTSESVTEGHPDKLADQVSDAILDAILSKDPLARVACETVLTTGLVLVAGEITTDCYVDIPRIIRQTIREAGYTRAKYGFDAETAGVLVSLDEQSPDIAQGVNVGGAGDSGVVVGYACEDTPEKMPMPIVIAHGIARRLAEARRTRALPYLRPDGKVQVTVGYDGAGRPAAVQDVVVAAQHHDEVDTEQVRHEVIEQVIAPVLEGGPPADEAQLHVNPTGRFVIGGPVADCGMTGRKIMVDTYGGWARHGGGGFSGKDPTKVDRAGAYGARHVAKTIVAAGLARRCEVQIAYAIGVVKPVAVRVDTQDTGTVAEPELVRAVGRLFDLSPLGIIKELNLRRPLYRAVACYGHFGRTDIDAPWEDTSRAAELKAEVG